MTDFPDPSALKIAGFTCDRCGESNLYNANRHAEPDLCPECRRGDNTEQTGLNQYNE